MSATRTRALWLATGLLSSAAVAVAVTASAAPGTSAPQATRGGGINVPVPLVTSDNVSLLTTLPHPGVISMEFALTGTFAYVSSSTDITVLDLADPKAPQVRGVLPVANFENESMTYGERIIDGELRRFVILAVDLVKLAPTAPGEVNLGGQELQLIDVTDPDNPVFGGKTEATTSTHTAQCVEQADCRYAYTAGTAGSFSVIDLTDLAAPAELKTVPSSAAGPSGPNSPFSSSGAGHYWDFDGVLGWHTGSGGAQAFDVSDPANPIPVTGTDEHARTTPYNDFILHNSMRPNAAAFTPGAEPSIANGNVLLVTEEDYANEGDEVVCERAGSFQTWYVPDLDGEAYRLRNPTGDKPDVGTVTPLDSTNAPAEFGGGLTTPASAFCSAHWFDVHQDGFVAQGWYGAGLRILDVRDARNIAQLGYSTSAATEVWDAYWVPVRDAAGVAVPGQKTNLVYTADAVRGIDVYEVTLP